MMRSFRNHVLRLVTSRKLEWGLLLVSLLPFFLISAYNHPTDDDFLNAIRGRTEGFFHFQTLLYTQATGRYTSSMLYAFGYGFSDLQSWLVLIKLAPVCWLLGLLGSAYFALGAVLTFRRSERARFALWGVLLFLHGMPLLATAIYWYCGAAVYTMGCIMTLLLVGAAGRALQVATAAARWGWGMLTTLIIVALIGCNEAYIGGVMGGIVLALLLGPARNRGLILGWVLAATAGGAASILAPGNFVRADVTMANGLKFGIGRLVAVVVKDVYVTQGHWAEWSNNALLWVATVLFVPVALRVHAHYVNPAPGSKWLRYPHSLLLAVILLAGFMLLMGVPTLLFSNDIPQRIWNYTYFLFLPTWFLLIQYLIGVSSRWHPWLHAMPPALSSSLRILFFVLILLGSGSAVNRAYVDLAFRAPAYSRAYQARYAAIQSARQAGQPTVALPPLVERAYQYPMTIFLHDLEPRATNIANLNLAAYFRIDSISLTHPPVPTARHMQDY